jgi:hypothetical protein
VPSYNRTDAATYAKKYAITPNPSYPPFPNDCTSFVSQAMLAGGWTMIGGNVFDRTSDDVWWWGKSSFTRASYTWGGAHNFSRFILRSVRGRACKRDELTIGDVVQISSGGQVFHSMVVTRAAAGGAGPFMCYHTTNTFEKDLGMIEGSYSAGAGYSFLYWKVKDVF